MNKKINLLPLSRVCSWERAKTRSYFSEGNSVSFPERYSKSENGWDFDILCMWCDGMWGDLCKYVALRALIRSVARAYALWNVFTCYTSFWLCPTGGGTPLYRLYRYVQPERVWEIWCRFKSVSNWVWFFHSSLELGKFLRSYFFHH